MDSAIALLQTRVIRQFLHLLIRWTLAISCVLLALPVASVWAAEKVEITRAQLESSDEGYKLALGFSFDLNRSLEDAIMRGVPLYFTTEVQLSRPRWYWFDEKTISTSHTIRISYNVLTHQYHAATNGRLQQSFNTLEDALSLIRRPNRWIVAEKVTLKAGEVYNVAVRMSLDVARLPKPFQVHALNSSDWQLSSDWRQFTYKAE